MKIWQPAVQVKGVKKTQLKKEELGEKKYANI